MGVNLYLSTDASAPVLTGQVGSLVALLDAVLVNGYGAKAGAGWTLANTGTNKRDYKQGTGSNGFYMSVNDAAPNNAQEAQVFGYETMSALGVGTQPFPTTSQSSFGNICRKSASADATARKWYCIADATMVYLFVDTGDNTNVSYTFAWGDFFSYMSGDTHNTLSIGRTAQGASGTGQDVLGTVGSFGGNGSTFLTSFVTSFGGGHYLDRHWNGLGGAQQFVKFSSALCTSPVGGSNSPCAYPNGPDGSLQLAPVWIGHSGSVRGYMKGLWAPLHYQPCGHGDQFSGTGNMSGKSFIALNIANGQVIVETSNTWS